MIRFRFESVIHFFLASAAIGVAVSYSRLYLFHVVLLFMVGLFVYSKTSGFKFTAQILPARMHYIVYAMFAWYCLSIVWSINRVYAAVYLFYIFCGGAIVVTMIYYATDLERQKKVLKTLSIVFVFELIISLLEGIGVMRWPISPFSSYVTYFGRNMSEIDPGLSEDVVASVLSMPTGFQWNPNNLAATMGIIFPFFLFHKRSLVKYVGAILVFAVVAMASSRGNFIALIFMLMLYLFFYSKKRAILSLVLIVPVLLNSHFLDKAKMSDNGKVREIAYSFDALKVYLSFEDTDASSIGIRTQLMHNGINALKETDGLGVGGGGSRAVQEDIGGVEGKITSMHNFWIEMLVDSGVLFTCLFIVWYITLLLANYRIYLSNTNEELTRYSGAISLSLAGFSIGAVSASSVIYLLPMWLLFGFAVTTINNYKRMRVVANQ